jgi:arabinan endo-1,5-alpha-L-arabinosidase
VFGSFGSGIKLIQLDGDGARVGDELLSLAQRSPDNPAIQAPFLMYRAPYFYLFVSFDRCCRGVSSTYNIRVGRANQIGGPYVDRDGVPMLQGGGALVLEGNDRWRGVGASTILTTRGQDYAVYHSYDANAAGRATLRISEVAWDSDGWPVLGGP